MLLLPLLVVSCPPCLPASGFLFYNALLVFVVTTNTMDTIKLGYENPSQVPPRRHDHGPPSSLITAGGLVSLMPPCCIVCSCPQVLNQIGNTLTKPAGQSHIKRGGTHSQNACQVLSE